MVLEQNWDRKNGHFKYLGYTLQRNNGTERHIKKTVRKTISAMKQIWSIKQRKFAGDLKRRICIFDHLVSFKSIIMHEAKIWERNKKQ